MLLKAFLQGVQPYKAVASQWACPSLCWGFSLSPKGSPSVLASCLWPWIMWHFFLLPSWSILHLLLAWVARSLCLSSRWLLQHCVDGATSPVLSFSLLWVRASLRKVSSCSCSASVDSLEQHVLHINSPIVAFSGGTSDPLWQRRTRKSYSESVGPPCYKVKTSGEILFWMGPRY